MVELKNNGTNNRLHQKSGALSGSRIGDSCSCRVIGGVSGSAVSDS